MNTAGWLDEVRYGPGGLVPVVAQERRTGSVLMVAWADRDALERTLATGFAHYYSRSRQAPWQKGETSGHVQRVAEVRLDCDHDTVLYRVDQSGPACHTGSATCFSTRVAADGTTSAEPDPGAVPLERLRQVIAERARGAHATSYTAQLLEQGLPRIAQKVGEEGVETVVAALAQDDGRVVSEAADLLYHLLVLLEARGIPLDDVWTELERRGR